MMPPTLPPATFLPTIPPLILPWGPMLIALSGILFAITASTTNAWLFTQHRRIWAWLQVTTWGLCGSFAYILARLIASCG